MLYFVNGTLSIHHTFHWLSTEIKVTLWHTSLSVHCADGVSANALPKREQNNTSIEKAAQKNGSQSWQQRLWVRILNCSREGKTAKHAARGRWEVKRKEERAHTAFVFQQSDDTPAVLHLHSMPVQGAIYGNVTHMWGVWTIAQPSPPPPEGRRAAGVVVLGFGSKAAVSILKQWVIKCKNGISAVLLFSSFSVWFWQHDTGPLKPGIKQLLCSTAA